MLTQNADTVGQMSCNPAVGGLAKGHMVREIDALGGAMGINTDATGIQFRMLNARKGPSVRAPRAQCDKKAYQFRMKATLEKQPRLHLKQGNVTRLLVKDDQAVGRTNFGVRFRAHDRRNETEHSCAVCSTSVSATRRAVAWEIPFPP